MKKISYLVLTAFVIVLFGACFSPWMGEDSGSITISVGGSERAALEWNENFDSNNLTHIITVYGNDTVQTEIVIGSKTVSFTVEPGFYDVIVEAFAEDESYDFMPIASGYQNDIEIKAGTRERVEIQMEAPVYALDLGKSLADNNWTLDFGNLYAGYTPIVKTITVTNIGNVFTGKLSITFDEETSNDAFVLSTNELDSIAPGRVNSFTITPKSELSEGIYNDVVTIANNNRDFLIYLNITLSVGGEAEHGQGTEENPFLIYTEEDLRAIGTNTGAYEEWTLDKHYMLMNNIDLTGSPNWEPIGDENNPFTGTFNGNGFVISNLNILSGNQDYTGLFGYIGTGGTVKNLGLIDVDINGHLYVGGIAGISKGTIENCYVTGTVSGRDVGGIAGQSYSVIQNCYSAAIVTGETVGGIAGYVYSGNISNCVALGKEINSNSIAGRIIGYRIYIQDDNLSNNYAWSGMTVKSAGNPISLTKGTSEKDGADITAAEAKTKETWETARFLFTDSTTLGPWVWNDANGMPSFGDKYVTWPSYLADTVSTPDTPFLIHNEADLRKVGTGSNGWTLDSHYKLMADIDLTGRPDWVRIGSSETASFTGTFDGNRFTITGLTINATTTYQGMFGYIQGGEVKNLGLIDVNIQSTQDYTGAITGFNEGTIENCFVTGSVIGGTYVGGIAGRNYGGTIIGCYTTANVKGTNFIGGIVGYSYSGNISNCVVLGKEINSNNFVGRITGYREYSPGDNFSNNYAWRGMTVKYEGNFMTFDKGTSENGGADITAAEAKTKETWKTAGFLFTDSTTQGPWVWNDANGMPSLGVKYVPWSDDFNIISTPADPLLIYNEADLRKVGTGNGGWTLHAHYKLMANIDLTDSPNWTRIGGAGEVFGFTGSFDGNGYTITGLTINATSTYQGMFGYIQGGEVKNLGLIDVDIQSTQFYTGAITGGLNEGIIENCYVTGSITGTAYVGGIAGDDSESGTIIGCYTNANVEGTTNYIGGIVGYSYGTVKDCVVLSNEIKSTTGGIGRITGFRQGIRSGNIAWRGVSINTTGTWTPNFADNGKDAPSVTAADIKDVTKWPSAFQGAPWDWSDTGKMPRLNNSAAQAWPSYLNDIYSTPTDPFLIYNEIDLRKVGTGSSGWTLDSHYKLMADIDLTGKPVWVRIGSSETAGFTGTFDGNGHTISGLTINASATYQGMFGYISTNAVVKNLGFVDVNIRSTTTPGTPSYVGTIAGYNEGTIENCYVTGTITGTSDYTGGITGQNAGTIEICYVTGSVIGFSYVGGIAGQNADTIENSFVTGLVNGGTFVGGIAGYNTGGTIVGCYTTANVEGSRFGFGGIAGYNTGGTVENCVVLSNEFITSNDSSSIGRITGNATGTLSGNLAWRGITISIMHESPANFADNGKDAPSITAADVMVDVSNWPIAFQNAPWVWNGNSGMPSLGGTVAEWPSYLEDIGLTSSDPILIRNEADLRKVGSHIDGWTLDSHYKLMADIDLTGKPDWVRIGYSNNAGFSGTFDGNGYTITGLTINTIMIYQGLFGYIKGGEVKNLGLIDVDIISTSTQGYVGTIAGHNSGTIVNCFATGSVKGTHSVGGITGGNIGGTVKGCYTAVNVEGTTNLIGGITGTNSNGTVENCVVLSNEIIATTIPQSIGRIKGNSSSAVGETNNYAWSGMTVTAEGNPVALDVGANRRDGADITTADAKTQVTWETAGFLFEDSTTPGPWIWNGANGMPSLGVKYAPWPDYLD